MERTPTMKKTETFLLMMCVLVIWVTSGIAAQEAKPPADAAAKPAEAAPAPEADKDAKVYSGMYTFLKEGEFVQITVEDEGPGIDPSERTKVFERFYRGSASGRRGTGTGTGLGLALVAEHMRLMHGEAWAESSATGGARFVIALPVLDENDSVTW